MPLRTYPLIAHPAYIAFVEHQRGRDHGLYGIKPAQVPTHRPVIRNISDIAEYLSVSPLFLRSILRRPWKHYRQFTFNKRSGGVREINSPRTFLKVFQWWILDAILYNSEVSPSVHGFVPYKSFISNAREHIGARHVLNLDVKDFFPSITEAHTASVFERLGYSEEVSSGLAKLTTLNGILPQGAPTSPMIANLLLADFDNWLAEYACQFGFNYTRYADDLTISSSSAIPKELVDHIAFRLGTHAMKLNSEKTRFMGANARKEVTGLVLGHNGVNLPREYLNGARGWFKMLGRKPGENISLYSRAKGTHSLIKQVGGAGSASVLEISEVTLAAMTAVRKSMLVSIAGT